MNKHETEINQKLSTYSPYGQASILFENIVLTDTPKTFRYHDDVRIAYFEEKYQFTLSDQVKNFVKKKLLSARGDRLLCMAHKMDRKVLIKRVKDEIMQTYYQNVKAEQQRTSGT